MIEKPKRPKKIPNQDNKQPQTIQELIRRYDLENTKIYDFLDVLVLQINKEQETIEESQLDVTETTFQNITVNKIRKNLKVCTLDCEGNFYYTAGTYNKVGKIPTEFLPKDVNYSGEDTLMYFVATCAGMIKMCQGKIDGSGNVVLYTDGSNVGNGQGVRIHTSWLIN